jgi:hypothetical protein
LKAYQAELVALFHPPKDRLPSYSPIRRALLQLDYREYSACLSQLFGIEPLPGERIAVDGKVLRGSYPSYVTLVKVKSRQNAESLSPNAVGYIEAILDLG